MLWYNSVSWTRYQKKLCVTIRDFIKVSVAIVYMNYIAALPLTKKVILLQFLRDCGVKTRLSKAKVLSYKVLSYTITKKLKRVFAAQKLLRVLKLQRVLSVRVLFVVISDRVLFMALSDRVLFESSGIGSSKVFLLKTDVLLYIISSKRRSHVTVSLTYFNKFQQNW